MTRVDGLDRPVGHQTWNVDAHPEVLISRHSNHLSGIISRELFVGNGSSMLIPWRSCVYAWLAKD
jgi:hypothetical protein